MSSEKLPYWFIRTNLYKNSLESFVKGKGMTSKAKIKIMFIVTATMLFGFVMMSNAPTGRIILSLVWLFHVAYFIWGIKTIPTNLHTAKKSEKVQHGINKNANI